MPCINVNDGVYDAETERQCLSCGRVLPIQKFDIIKVNKSGLRRRRRKCYKCRGYGGEIELPSLTTEKSCSSCGRILPVDKFNITHAREGRAHHRGVCLDCDRERVNSRRRALRREKSRMQKSETPVDLTGAVTKTEMALALLEMARWNPARLDRITKAKYVRYTNAGPALRSSGISWGDLKDTAIEILDERGMLADKSAEYGPGCYMVIGDSHGKHMRRRTFTLLQRLITAVEPDRVIHIGHLLDDDGDASNLWDKLDDKLVVVARSEERAEIRRLGYRFVQDHVKIGDWSIGNQDLMQDYVKTYIGRLDAELFKGNTVINRHLHERHTRCSESSGRYTVASPGCLCEGHIVKTIRQIDFTDKYKVRVAYPEGFIKYRRAKHLHEYWEQGILLVYLDDDGNSWLEQLRIRDVDGDKYACWNSTVFSSKRAKPVKPHKVAVLRSDVHAPRHSPDTLAAVDALARGVACDQLIDLGDLYDMRAVNPHIMKNNFVGDLAGVDFLDDAAAVRYILSTSKDLDTVIFFGNHERFSKDFTRRYPQFTSLLSHELLTGSSATRIDHLDSYRFGNAVMVHGDQRMYGASGRLAEKLVRTYAPEDNGCIFFGHVHYPAIRRGAYSVGLSGLLDQGYNEVKVSQWLPGAAVVCTYKDMTFPQLVDIHGSTACYGGRKYEGDPDKFDTSKLEYKANLTFDFE